MERSGGRGCKQALWHVYTNHPHLNDEYENDEENKHARERQMRKRDEETGEIGGEREREAKGGKRGAIGVFTVTAYGNGGVC